MMLKTYRKQDPKAVWIMDMAPVIRNTFRLDNVQNIHTIGSLMCGNMALVTRSSAR